MVATPPEGARVVIEDATVDVHGRVTAVVKVTRDGAPLLLPEVIALAPRFTLARLTDHPADGQRAWESLLLVGARIAPSLPPGGPDDPDVLTSVAQPGAESAASSLVDLGGGRFRYPFASAGPVPSAAETLRVGVWLAGAEAPSLFTSTTFDFTASGGPVEARDTVLDDNCASCHGHAVVAHETRVGVKLCLTCHTWQNTDPLTVDPAASSGATARTNPNPLELGRLVHRLHRGKDLPTLFQTAWDGVSMTSVVVPNAPAFVPGYVKGGGAGRPLIPGRKFSVVREDGSERVFAAALVLGTFDPTLGGTMVLAAGGVFPRDLRDCAVCHANAPQGAVVRDAVTRRICSGCHPEVWFREASPLPDRSRYPHPGGAQLDDTRCADCHVTGALRLYAPLDEVHVSPVRAPRYDRPVFEITRVEDLVPGGRPRVTFRARDRVGPIVPSLRTPSPAFDPAPVSSSWVARGFAANGVAIRIVGAAEHDYSGPTAAQLHSGTSAGNPDPTLLATTGLSDEYVYTFSSTLPLSATGTFVVGLEARRSWSPPGGSPYDAAHDAFLWPYTGETVNETPENVFVYVSSASGTWTKAAGSPGAKPRRVVVTVEKCNRCHDRIEFHGTQRHDPNWCVICHMPDATDLPQRLGVAGRRWAGGPVNVGATFDGVEERNTHLKRMVHRIHTGAREGAASLDGIAPFAQYYGRAYFFDRGGFPGDLRNCTLCHEGKSYLAEAVPEGAAPSRGNETGAVYHWTGSNVRGIDSGSIGLLHPDDEPVVLPVTAACTSCHATGATFAHVAAKTVNGVETCTQCHARGAVSVEVAHGLAPASATGASASFASIVANVLVPGCATSACHAAGAQAPRLDAAGAYAALVGVQSGQSGLRYVDPSSPETSYLVHKLRGTAGSVGGSGTIMPPDGALPAADQAAIEAWISNGAPND